MKKDTLLTHVGRNPAETHGTVNMPVYRTSTVVFPDLESYETRDPDDYKSMRYGIHGTPTTFAFEDAVARMEGGYPPRRPLALLPQPAAARTLLRMPLIMMISMAIVACVTRSACSIG